MKVLIINSVCGIRSTGRICTNLADSLELQGHEVKIAYGRENVPDEYQKYAVRIGNDFDFKFHGLKARLLDNSGFGSKRATEIFIKWVKEYNPDVIHLHNIHGYYINIEVLFEYLRTCAKKIIWTLHDCWAFTGHSAYCDAINCSRWKNGCGKCLQIREYPKSYVDRSEHNWKKKKKLFSDIPNLMIVTPSKWLAELVKKSFLGNYPIEIINNGVDKNIFRFIDSDLKKQYGLEGKKIILGVASVWDKRKGIEDFIKLANLLTDEYRIVLIGVNEKQKKNLKSNMIGISRTSNIKELVEWYSLADFFLNTTYEDNYPTVNLEAQACGTPVITYRTGGSPESVPENNVVEQGNLIAVKKRMEECLCINAEVQTSKQMSDSYMRLYIIE